MARWFCTRVLAQRTGWFLPLRPGHHPVRLPCCDRMRCHPGGEAFVQPDVVPPCGGDQVAEPLVRHFVRDDVGHSLLRADGRGLVVDQQRGLAIDDGAPVLHGAGLEVRHGDVVELGQRILNSVIAVVVVQEGLRGVQREVRHVLFAGHGADAYLHAVECDRRRTSSRRRSAPPGSSTSSARWRT